MTRSHKPRILVLGGSGFVGRHVCEHLVRAGCDVTVPTRRPDRANVVQTLPGVTVLRASVHDDTELQSLVQGHDVVINLIAILHGNAAQFEMAHVRLPQRLAQAMQDAGVHRLVHVSALGADPAGPSHYQRSKGRGEAVLHQAPLDLTILRPSVIFGAEDRFLNLFARLQRLAPVLPLAGGRTRFQPVWVVDVARAVVHCALHPPTAGHTYEACGPDVFTLAELVRLSGQWAGICGGHGRIVLPLPLWMGYPQALAMELLPGEPLMSRDNLASMHVNNVASGDTPGLPTLGIQPAALAAVAPTYLGQRGPRSRLDLYRARR